MDFDNFNPTVDKNIGFRNIDTQYAYNIYKFNSKYFNIDIKQKLFIKTQPYTILKNQFPYYWKNAKHYILWINPIYENFYNLKRIIDIIKSIFINKQIKFWENDVINRSILSVRHIHIIEKV